MFVTQKPVVQSAPAGKPHAAKTGEVNFAGIYANHATNVNHQSYVDAFHKSPEQHLLRPFATSLFREFYSSNAIGQLLKDGVPTRISILGCSDGSEARSYGMSAQQYLKKKQMQDPKHIEIKGIDREADLIGLANTGYLMMTDVEKARQLQPENPLNPPQSKFPSFFETKKQAPEGFDKLVEQSPQGRLAQIEADPVSGIKVGEGMNWVKAKPKALSKTTFEVNTIEDYAAKPASGHQRQVYVLANSWGYMMAKDASNTAAIQIDPSDTAKCMQFLKVVQDLKKNNAGKDVVLVVGDIERTILQRVPAIKNILPVLGLKEMSIQEMQQAGITDSPERVAGKLWKLTT